MTRAEAAPVQTVPPQVEPDRALRKFRSHISTICDTIRSDSWAPSDASVNFNTSAICALMAAAAVLAAGGDVTRPEHESDLRDLLDRLRIKTNDFVSETNLIAAPPLVADAPLIDHFNRLIEEAELKSLWRSTTAICYSHQYSVSAARRSSQTSIQTANKSITRQQLTSFTQLYTPSWVVDYILHRCRGSIAGPQPTFLDPACGAGNMLLGALQNFCGEGDSANVNDIVRSRIFGADIDATAMWVCSLAIFCEITRRTRKSPDFKCHSLVLMDQHLLGSLQKDLPEEHILGKTFDIVATNPPYLGRKLLSRELKQELKRAYPRNAHDLCAPFIERGLEWLKPGGMLGYITQSSVLSLPSYMSLRKAIVQEFDLVQVVEMGSAVFPLQGGEKVDSTLIFVRAPHEVPSGGETLFANIDSRADKQAALQELKIASTNRMPRLITAKSRDHLASLPNFILRGDCPDLLVRMLATCRKLGDIADVRQGLATTDNARFLRYWWDVPARANENENWVPYLKGAGTQRWVSPIVDRVDWTDNGSRIKAAVAAKYPYLSGKTAWVVKNEQYYFKPGLCFSFISTGGFAVRRLPAGCIFDVAASAIFLGEPEIDFCLAYLNSGLMRAVCKLVNPTINVQVGDIKRLPLLTYPPQTKERMAQIARECCSLTGKLNALFEPVSHEGPGSDHREELDSKLAFLQESPELDVQAGYFLAELEQHSRRIRDLEAENDELAISHANEVESAAENERDQLREWVASQPRATGVISSANRESAGAEKSGRQAAPNSIEVALANRLLLHAIESTALRVTDLPIEHPVLSAWIESKLGKPIAEVAAKDFPRFLQRFYRKRIPRHINDKTP